MYEDGVRDEHDRTVAALVERDAARADAERLAAMIREWRIAVATQRHVDGCYTTSSHFLAVCDAALAAHDALTEDKQ